MKLQRGFVVLPGLPAKPAGSMAALRAAILRSGLAVISTVQRARNFAAGILVGLGIWAPVFASMNEDPGAWAAAGSVLLFGLAGVGIRRGG
jgi:uncharacterized membrane protein YccC